MATNLDRKQQVDAVIAFIFLKKLLTPIAQTDSFKKGLVNDRGMPISQEANKKVSILDKIIFKLKRLLGGRMNTLNKYIYVKTLGGDFTKNIIPMAGIGNRAEVKRLMRDLSKINEKYDIGGLDQMFEMILHNEMIEMTDHNGYIKEEYFR